MEGSKKKVGYLVPEFPAQTHIFFWREICELRKLGCEIEIISSKKPDLNEVKHDFSRSASEQTFYLHPPNFSSLFYPFCHPRFLAKAIKYVFSTDTDAIGRFKILYLIIAAANLLKYCKKKQISHVHGHSCANVAHVLAIASITKKISYSLTLHGGLRVYGDSHFQKMKNAKFVSTVTKPLQIDVVSSVGIPLEKVPVISMGVDIDKFNFMNTNPNLNEPLRLITVARLAQGKGHSYSLKALARLDKKGITFHFTIVGGGDYFETLKALVRELNLEDKVTFTGTLSESDVINHLKSSDVILLTSTGDFEAAPVCIMEAMALGIPSVTSIIGGTSDMIDNGVNGFLVEQKNIDEIELAIEKYAIDRVMMAKFGEAAREKAESDFDASKQAARLLNYITY